jgi:SAM-dependent methyltransferase
VGVDLTRAVDAAARNLRAWPNVHLVQADITALPFRDETFDVVYSIGVLHHTPDTAAAFRRVAGAVKKGGQLAVYLYLAGGLARYFSDAFRVITTRLPRPVVYYGSAVAIPLYFLHRLPGLGRVSQTLLPTNVHPDWRWRWLDTFDWYTPSFQWKHRYPEVIRWFREAGFSDLYVADEPICVRGLKVQAP